MIIHKNLLKDAGRLFFWYPIRWLVLLLPFSAVYFLGGLFGRIDLLASGGRRRAVMLGNIEAALGCAPQEARRILEANIQTHCRNVLEFLKYPSLVKKGRAAKVVSVRGGENLAAAAAQGRGVILATAHFGAKQQLQVVVPALGYKVNQYIYHAPPSELSFVQRQVAQRLRLRIEASFPVAYMQAGRFLRKGFECLKAGEVLILAADGSGVADHIDASYKAFPFLKSQILLPVNMVPLARKTGAAIVPVFVVRNGWRHEVVFEPALPLADASDEAAMTQYARLLESHICARPELWEFWEEFCEGKLVPGAASSRA